MKKPIIIALLAIITTGVQAQDTVKKQQRTPQERAHARTERMAKDLGLSGDQLSRVEAINLKYAEQVEAMRSEGEKHHKDVREAYDSELQTVLSPEQYGTWLKQREEMKAKHRQKRAEMKEQQRSGRAAEPKP